MNENKVLYARAEWKLTELLSHFKNIHAQQTVHIISKMSQVLGRKLSSREKSDSAQDAKCMKYEFLSLNVLKAKFHIKNNNEVGNRFGVERSYRHKSVAKRSNEAEEKT